MFLLERRLTTFPVLCDSRTVRCALGNAALTLLEGRAVVSEADQVAAWERCRWRVEALVGRLLLTGRGGKGGLIITPEDAAHLQGQALAGGPAPDPCRQPECSPCAILAHARATFRLHPHPRVLMTVAAVACPLAWATGQAPQPSS